MNNEDGTEVWAAYNSAGLFFILSVAHTKIRSEDLFLMHMCNFNAKNFRSSKECCAVRENELKRAFNIGWQIRKAKLILVEGEK
jgi:hypothetical protein